MAVWYTHTNSQSPALPRKHKGARSVMHCIAGRRPGVCTDHPCGSKQSTPRGPFPAVRLSLLPGICSMLLNEVLAMNVVGRIHPRRGVTACHQ